MGLSANPIATGCLIAALWSPAVVLVAQSQRVAPPAPAPNPDTRSLGTAAVVDPAILKLRCDSGDGQACFDLGLRYDRGSEVAKDPAMAADLYRLGCDRGSARACVFLGYMLTWGHSIKQDWAQAAVLFQKACNARDSLGCTSSKSLQSIVQASAEAQKASPDCTRYLTLAEPALYVFFPRPDAASRAIYDRIIVCGLAKDRFMTITTAGERQLAAGKEYVTFPWALPSAYYRMAEFEKARQAQQTLARLFPGDGSLVALDAMMSLRAEKDADAVEQATRAINAVPRDAAAKLVTSMVAHGVRARALIRLGRLREAEDDIDALSAFQSSADIAKGLRKELVAARQRGFTVEQVAQSEIPLGTYHLFGNTQGALGGWLVHLRLDNVEPADRELIVEVSIPGVSQVFKRDTILLKGGKEHLYITPPLIAGFDRRSVVDEQPVEIDVRISQRTRAGDQVLYEESTPAKLLGFDYLLLKQRVAEEAYRSTYGLIAAWVTPTAPQIEAFLTAAKKRAPSQTFNGEQGPTIPEVRALWDELQARGVSYVTDPAVGSTIAVYQRVRFPTEVLESTNADCLEGAILFATLMKAIGLKPVIVVIPGHAFVGWRASGGDGNAAGKLFFLETTVVHSKRLEDAIEIGKREYDEQVNLGNFASGRARVLDISALQSGGIASAAIR